MIGAASAVLTAQSTYFAHMKEQEFQHYLLTRGIIGDGCDAGCTYCGRTKPNKGKHSCDGCGAPRITYTRKAAPK